MRNTNNEFLSDLERRFNSMQQYEDKRIQQKALAALPLLLLEQRAQERMRALQNAIKKGMSPPEFLYSCRKITVFKYAVFEVKTDFDRLCYIRLLGTDEVRFYIDICCLLGETEDLDVTIQEMLLLELLAWFKQNFEWVDSPDCDYCGNETKFSHMSSDRKLLEHASRVEVSRKCQKTYLYIKNDGWERREANPSKKKYFFIKYLF